MKPFPQEEVEKTPGEHHHSESAQPDTCKSQPVHKIFPHLVVKYNYSWITKIDSIFGMIIFVYHILLLFL